MTVSSQKFPTFVIPLENNVACHALQPTPSQFRCNKDLQNQNGHNPIRSLRSYSMKTDRPSRLFRTIFSLQFAGLGNSASSLPISPHAQHAPQLPVFCSSNCDSATPEHFTPTMLKWWLTLGNCVIASSANFADGAPSFILQKPMIRPLPSKPGKPRRFSAFCLFTSLQVNWQITIHNKGPNLILATNLFFPAASAQTG